MARRPPVTLTLLIPGRNEQLHIGRMLDELAQQSFVQRMGERFDVLVIDDGSTDHMAEVAQTRASRFARLRVLRLEQNLGKGLALQRGFAEATGDVVGFVDGDHTFDLGSLERFYEAIRDGADVAIGDRRLPSSVFHLPADTIPYIHLRAFVGQRFNDVVRLATKLELADTQCGFKFFRRAAGRAAFAKIRVGGFVFDLEVLLAAQAAGRTIMPLPVTLKYKNPEPVSDLAKMSSTIGLAFLKVLRNHRAGLYRP